LISAVSDAVAETKILNSQFPIYISEQSEEAVEGIFGMIVQLVTIFIDNAIKYSPTHDNGTKDPISVTISGDSAGCYLSVKDLGIGIGEEDLPFIFERFYRADKSHNNKIPGFGLGLAIADMIARAHNATIAVYSELGAGTEFIVSFPKYEPESNA
jgi:signal transduction histidine kinase